MLTQHLLATNEKTLEIYVDNRLRKSNSRLHKHDTVVITVHYNQNTDFFKLIQHATVHRPSNVTTENILHWTKSVPRFVCLITSPPFYFMLFNFPLFYTVRNNSVMQEERSKNIPSHSNDLGEHK